jgi:hypothetical protein
MRKALILGLAIAALALAQTAATSKVTGIVTGPDGNPVAHARVVLRDGDNNLLRAMTAEDGSWMITGVKPGTYHLTVRGEPGTATYEVNQLAVQGGRPVQEDVRLKPLVEPLESPRGELRNVRIEDLPRFPGPIYSAADCFPGLSELGKDKAKPAAPKPSK